MEDVAIQRGGNERPQETLPEAATAAPPEGLPASAVRSSEKTEDVTDENEEIGEGNAEDETKKQQEQLQLPQQPQQSGEKGHSSSNRKNNRMDIPRTMAKYPKKIKTPFVQMPLQIQATVTAAPRSPTPPPLFRFLLLLRVRLRLRWWPRESECERAVHRPHTHSSFSLCVCVPLHGLSSSPHPTKHTQ
ncbi:hypothetical protein TCDM_10272 [Trypanosoma cruzi Dm28c]|uniref:Mucin-associated surface protein (MASP) n=1 Tax=Trypanosoma cruzi Dm28c TaxID=1416333 RepID=V5D3R0_TRYCR|nr:hypothetical protein TCDM_10272 [Trypanosoma cruzi Dm28c]